MWAPFRLDLPNKSVWRFNGSDESAEFWTLTRKWLSVDAKDIGRSPGRLQYYQVWKVLDLFLAAGLVASKAEFSKVTPKINLELVKADDYVSDDLVHAQFEHDLNLMGFGRNAFMLQTGKRSKAIVRVWADPDRKLRFLVLS